MSLVEEAIQNAGVVYNGGVNAPIGSFWNPRTNAIAQNTSDAVLPASGIWIPVTTSGTSTLSQCATAINALVSGLAYTSSNLHAYSSSTDLAQSQGQKTNDG